MLDFTKTLHFLPGDIDVTTKEQLGNDIRYKTLCKIKEDVLRFNYRSDYWGDAESYQEENEKAFELIEPYIGEEISIDFDDEGTCNFLLIGMIIDKQYNDISHTEILVEEIPQ